MKASVGRWLELRGACKIILIIFGCLLTSACLTQGTGSESGTEVVASPDEVLPPLTSPERTICDPFNAGATARDRGVVANLVYLRDDQPRYTKATDYITNGEVVQSTLYFDKLFVPTRAFDLGFYTQDGRLVTNANDEPIYEYFGVRAESQLTLGAAESPGWYQVAVLSDDGSVVKVRNSDDSYTTLINNDGTHPTRMGCATKSVYVDGVNKIPVVIEYYQGPRYHISLVVLWRPLPEGVSPDDPVSDIECGQKGNSRYFDSTKVPSQPSATYFDLLSRGWKPLENENYYFPEQASNPCVSEDPLLITGFAITQTTRTSVTVQWQTSQKATSHVEAKDVNTNVVYQTSETTDATMTHIVTLTGLSPNTLYSVRGVSKTGSNQTAQSSELAFRTAR